MVRPGRIRLHGAGRLLTGFFVILGGEAIGDALAGSVSLPVDAVGVDLQQDSGAVLGAAGDLWSRAPRSSATATRWRAAGRRDDGRARRPTLRRGKALSGFGPDGAVGQVLDDPAAGGLEDAPSLKNQRSVTLP